MPELPEVETIRRDLSQKIIGKKITKVLVCRKNMVTGGTVAGFIKDLKGEKIVKVDRVGKLIIFGLKAKDKYLLMHMKMMGQLVYCVKTQNPVSKQCIPGGHPYPTIDKLPNKNSRIIYKFEDGSKLYFNDQRTFGYARIVDGKSLDKIKKNFGIEPLQKNFTFPNLQKAFMNRKKNIKAVLMDQKIIAGIGNIYADEILWEAKIRPNRSAGKLKEDEIKAIYKSTNKIIEKAIKWRGTTFSDYRDPNGKKGNYMRYLNVYGREGKLCKRCKKTKIKKIKLSGRGTRYCPRCQK